MPAEVWAITSGVLASLLAALAGFELKRAAGGTSLALRDFHLSLRLLWAICLYLLSSVFFLVALLRIELSVLVPVTALEYIWIVFLAKKFLREEIRFSKCLGIGLIVFGVILVGLGS